MNFELYKNTLPLVSRKVNLDAYNAYLDETFRLENLFVKDLFEELGIVGNPKAEMLWNKAWDRGNSSGYSEVYNEALDLVELIK